jgi:hypothetical protein
MSDGCINRDPKHLEAYTAEECAAYKGAVECSCHREYSRWNHEECCGHEEGRNPNCPLHGDGSTDNSR